MGLFYTLNLYIQKVVLSRAAQHILKFGLRQTLAINGAILSLLSRSQISFHLRFREIEIIKSYV